MKKTVLIFGLLVIALATLFQLSKFSYLSGNLSIEILIACIAIVFFFIGIYINKQSINKRKSENTEIDYKKIDELNISNREYEVLCEIAKGFSNKEIAERLFVSESTIKSHVSSILVKLNAKRRTQAIKISKQLRILPF
ncbi:response regulator transcription factor [Aureibaculum sp. 2210JD6-5]|uniref:response regulator transcription factor n=1 Tax=Aureibaculum sp. 2210JD6-5 TaxID=3103957 RepID=UPI002AACCE0A|nr:response regulator transcription factor [Aureibaculum sp. 2210JD6-5]MDY7394503.1 response regulator transcription factor [Aureibaculum sp. 2210JD6-5]